MLEIMKMTEVNSEMRKKLCRNFRKTEKSIRSITYLPTALGPVNIGSEIASIVLVLILNRNSVRSAESLPNLQATSWLK